VDGEEELMIGIVLEAAVKSAGVILAAKQKLQHDLPQHEKLFGRLNLKDNEEDEEEEEGDDNAADNNGSSRFQSNSIRSTSSRSVPLADSGDDDDGSRCLLQSLADTTAALVLGNFSFSSAELRSP
jgi:hypothetical protein